jgi:hypothetical protein
MADSESFLFHPSFLLDCVRHLALCLAVVFSLHNGSGVCHPPGPAVGGPDQQFV